MSEGRHESPTEDRDSPPAAPASLPAEESPIEPRPLARAARTERSAAAIWVPLAVLLVLVIGAVALSPYWAPAIERLLPWGRSPATADYDALALRVAALEQRPAPPAIDVAAITAAQEAADNRVAALQTAVNTLREDRTPSAATTAALAQLAQRLDQIETQATARTAAESAEMQKIRQELAQRSAVSGDLGSRLAALEHRVQAQSNADRAGSVLLLALLQMREAVEEARPFPAEYAAFKQLAARDPELTAAAEPLADAAQTGVASRVALRQGLADLAEQVPAATPRAAKLKWWTQALDRLRALITIRHIDGNAAAGPKAAVAAAQTDLARGDLATAVAALEKLTGADLGLAQPWLRLARQRLAAETALTHVQELLTVRLGALPAATPTSAPPAMPAPPSPPSRDPS